MNRFLDDFVPYIPIILLIFFMCFYDYKDQIAKESPSVKAEPVETLVPTHTAKCTETKGNTCITYTIYRVTNP